jgi:hypothetical protein
MQLEGLKEQDFELPYVFERKSAKEILLDSMLSMFETKLET